jgi:hypothetical protein
VAAASRDVDRKIGVGQVRDERLRSVWQALLAGPASALHLHRAGWTLGGPRAHRWILAEVIALGIVLTAAALINFLPLRAHVATMVVGQCFTAFFAVWTVHHDCEPAGRIARTQRGWLKNILPTTCSITWSTICFPPCPPVTFRSCPDGWIWWHRTTRTSACTDRHVKRRSNSIRGAPAMNDGVSQFVGTLRFSSSNQFWTSTI